MCSVKFVRLSCIVFHCFRHSECCDYNAAWKLRGNDCQLHRWHYKRFQHGYLQDQLSTWNDVLVSHSKFAPILRLNQTLWLNHSTANADIEQIINEFGQISSVHGSPSHQKRRISGGCLLHLLIVTDFGAAHSSDYRVHCTGPTDD